MTAAGVIERYLALGLAMNGHIDGFVDAYYGPPAVAARVEAEGVVPPAALLAEARALLVALDDAEPLGDPGAPAPPGAADHDGASAAGRRHWLKAQVLGLLTTARMLSGEKIGYADEVEACYGVRPRRSTEEEFQAAHRPLDEVVPGSGPLAERYVAWRESQAVPVDELDAAIHSLADDLRERTATLFGLPDGERIEFELVTDQPWSGFNYYLGELHSRVAVERRPPGALDLARPPRRARGLPRSPHRAHPQGGRARAGPPLLRGVDLPRRHAPVPARRGPRRPRPRGRDGPPPRTAVAEHLRPLGIPYDPDVVAVVAEAGEALQAVRATAAFRLHEDGADPDAVADEVARFGLPPEARAEKTVEFLLDPVWRAYISCYVEGLPLCRRFVAGDPARFARLVTEQLRRASSPSRHLPPPDRRARRPWRRDVAARPPAAVR